MTNKEIAEMFERHNLVRGYVYPYEGYRSEYWFERAPSNIANFIMRHSDAREIILTDTMDNLILNTMGEFIDRCPDQALLQQILPHLIPMQLGEAEPQDFPSATDAEVEAHFSMQDSMEMELGM
ncbi:resolvase [Lacrimispora defluvii]|uniref:Resolvase n=1 Tax=Lacrimispora defluvii TaxID=2719233 RepID=A0ABX1VNV2_9FIRM|nr:resolvase [Lacrimispora defluvii]NNJ28577.1 resolvase [Lacrimispora defluvii]